MRKQAANLIVDEEYAKISKDLAFVGSKSWGIAIHARNMPLTRKYKAFLLKKLLKVAWRMLVQIIKL